MDSGRGHRKLHLCLYSNFLKKNKTQKYEQKAKCYDLLKLNGWYPGGSFCFFNSLFFEFKKLNFIVKLSQNVYFMLKILNRSLIFLAHVQISCSNI